MALVVVATFLNLTEAHVAAGALESGGMHPVVMDQGFGSVLWSEQFALQGFRLAVLGSEAAEAREFFSILPARRVRRRRLRTDEVLWRLATLPALVLSGPYLAWLVAGGIQRRRRGATGEMLAGGAVAVMAAAVGALIIGSVVILALLLAAALSRTAWPLLPLLAAIVIAVIAGRRGHHDTD